MSLVLQSLPSNPNSAFGGTSIASAMSELSLGLTTAGPERPGFVRITWTWNPGRPYDGSSAASLIIGPWFSSPALMLSGSGCCSMLFPVELGQAFSFDTSASMIAYATGQDGISTGFNDASVKLEFFDADGSIPVRIMESAITAVPEPGLLGIFAVLGTGLCAKFRRDARASRA